MTRGGRKRTRTEPQRRCVVSGESGPCAGLVRFVIAPDGSVVPDVAERLPGRGIWVRAQHALVEKAVSRGHFARAARRTGVAAPGDLVARTERALTRRLQELLGLAQRAGRMVRGFEKVRARLRSGEPVGTLVEARDGSEDGLRKLRALRPGVPTLNCLDAAELGAAWGQVHVVHAVLEPGTMTDRILREAERLAGFREPAETGQCSRTAARQASRTAEAIH